MKVSAVVNVDVEVEVPVDVDDITAVLRDGLGYIKKQGGDVNDTIKQRWLLDFLNSVYGCLKAVDDEAIALLTDCQKEHVRTGFTQEIARICSEASHA